MGLISKIQNWILSKLIQFSTFIQIICLIVMGFVNVGNVFNYYEGGRIIMPEASYYLCWFIRFLKESEHKNYALASIIVVNVCLIYWTWMEKPSFEYWKWRQEKTGRVLLEWLNITGFVSTMVETTWKISSGLLHFCTFESFKNQSP